jgi:hypothetical protein
MFSFRDPEAADEVTETYNVSFYSFIFHSLTNFIIVCLPSV